MQNVQTPKTREELRSFIGLINYHRDMHWRRSHYVAPLTKLTSSNVKFKWTDEHQNDFDTMKKIISRDALLACPDFNKPFNIHTDASDCQLGTVIGQEGKPTAFCSRKLNSAQWNYPVGEK